MGELGNASEIEAELIKRNREIAKVRDEIIKLERRLQESGLRNDELLEKVSELDSDVTKKSSHANDLQLQVESLEGKLEESSSEVKHLQEELQTQAETAQQEMAAREAAWKEDSTASDELKAQIADLESTKEQLQQQLDDEQRRHADAMARLDQSEASGSEAAQRATELRRQKKELEAQLEETKAKLSGEKAKEVEEERLKAREEESRLSGLLDESVALRKELEDQCKLQVSEFDLKLAKLTAELDDSITQLSECQRQRDSIESERNELSQSLEELRTSQADAMQAERRRHEEQLEQATSQVASLDGRLTGQRLLFQETSEALAKSEETEAQLAEDLAAKLQELKSEHALARASVENAQLQAAQELSAKEARLAATLESEELCLQRQARAEVDAATRASSEAQEEQRRLQARLDRTSADENELQVQHKSLLESLRGQISELRQRLAEAEERSLQEAKEVERLERLKDDATAEAERTGMAHKFEIEKLQRQLEAEIQSRASAEQVASSKLEEKQTLLDHRDADLQRLQTDLEDARKRAVSLEEQLEQGVAQARAEGEAKASSMAARIAQLQGDLVKAEGHLEAQRQSFEQLKDSLSQANTDKESLLETKGSLEAQLKLELSHKDAVAASLTAAQEESSARIKNLEEQLRTDADHHREAQEEIKRSFSQELSQASERLTSLEAELRSTREQCENLARLKADLQQELGEKQEQQSGFEARLQEQRAAQESSALELEQLRRSKQQIEEERDRLQEEKIVRESEIKQLKLQVSQADEQCSQQCDDFGTKVHQLDSLLTAEREQREASERTVRAVRQELDDKEFEWEQAKKKGEQDLLLEISKGQERSTELEEQLARAKEQAKADQVRAEDLETQRRKDEADLRGEIAASEAKLRRLEAEVQRHEASATQQQAALAQQQAEAAMKINDLGRQLEEMTENCKLLEASKIELQDKAKTQGEGSDFLRERNAMTLEELSTRQADFVLEKQRLSGALEESRRTLRFSLGVPNPTAAVESARVAGLEQQLSEERQKSIEQAVTVQRLERRCAQLEAAQRHAEEQRSSSSLQNRTAERAKLQLEEDLRKTQLRLISTDQRAGEARERAAMSAAEIATVRHDSSYEVAHLRGALDELRYMLRKQPMSPVSN